MGLLDIYPIINIRRNHGLEHATIHVLSERNAHLSMVGRSDWAGFTLYGNIDIDEITYAANEALNRLRQGQQDLAVHPRCGTILATTGLLTGLSAFMAIGISGKPLKRFRWAAIPEAILAATLASIVAQPLGLLLQEHLTVSGNPGDLAITRIFPLSTAMPAYRIETRQ